MNGVFVEDPKKKSAQSYALRQTQATLEKVSWLQDTVRSLVSLLDYTAGGAPSGLGEMLTGCCQRALSELSAAQSSLSHAAGEIRALEPGEWVPAEVAEGGLRCFRGSR